jgi:aquaporin Z
MEALGLGLFMVSACGFGTLLEHPGSPVRAAIPDPLARRALMGLAMGATAVALIYSPWGQRSGAHLNPSVTWTFWRLGRVGTPDAIGYTAAQLGGGTLGVALMGALLGPALADPAVRFVVTRPGEPGVAAAFLAETAISFGLMSVVLQTSGRPRLMRYTGLFAGSLVALWIVVEAPLSGMSMNPARTFGSSLAARDWTAWWLYVVAPPLGMVAAAEVYRLAGRARHGCAKLHHPTHVRCHFCGQGGEAATRAAGAVGATADRTGAGSLGAPAAAVAPAPARGEPSEATHD